MREVYNLKKIIFLCVFIVIFFVSVSFVYSADTNIVVNSTDPNKNSTDTSKNITTYSGNNNFTITVSHNKIEHGKPINFVVTGKDSNGNPVSNHRFAFSLRSRNDKSNPDGRFTNIDYTDENGVFYEYWPGNSGYFDYYDLTISDDLDESQYPQGTVYYREAFDLTLKPSMALDISNYNIYEGQYTQVKVYVKVNSNPVEGYLVWYYGNGKDATTKLTNGVSIFKYNSYNLGNNPIFVKYIGLSSVIVIPGHVVSTTANKTFNIYVKAAPDLIISKIARNGNRYKVTVKNIGKTASASTKLKLGYKTNYKAVKFAALSSGKSRTVIVNFNYNQYNKYTKYAWINYNKASFEKNYKDNKISFKSTPYVGLLPDLTITKISRSGNNILVTVKNQGNNPSSGFKILVCYVSKKKGKGYIEFNAKKFGQFGQKLPAGASLILTLPYLKYKKTFKIL
jgi:CARDB protein